MDPVWHLYSLDGRLFFHNQDWGGVLEIPEGFTPEDDLWQAELSFHGRIVPSGPDGVEFIAAVQWDRAAETRAANVVRMVDRYPFSPDGSFHAGEAVK